MLKIGLTLMTVLMVTMNAFAQQERKIIRSGNELFNKQDFEKAEVEYRKALDTKEDSYEAAFNLGDALYKQKKYEEALQQFDNLVKGETDKERLGELYHNIGNTLLAMNKPQESIEAYKQSLLNRPVSQDTKYNLEFARQLLQQQQQNQQQDNNQQQNQDQQNQDQQNQDQQNQNQQNQEQNKDQQNKNQQNQEQNQQGQQDKNKQQQQDKGQQEQNKEQQPQQQNGEQQQDGKISKEDAERLLGALENEEKKTQEKVQKQKAQSQQAKKMKIEKNW